MASSFLPPKMAEMRQDLGDLLLPVRNQGLHGSVLLLSRRTLRIELDNTTEKILSAQPKDGTIVSVFDGQRISERATAGFDRDAAQKSIKNILDTSQRRESATGIGTGAAVSEDFVTPMEIDPQDLSTEDKLTRCREIHHMARTCSQKIVNVRLFYSEANETSVFRGPDTDRGQRVQRVALFLVVMVGGPDGERRFDFVAKTGTRGWEALSFTQEELEEVGQRAESLIGAERIPPGEYTIIAAPDVSGTICHESFGHGVETDMFLKGRARAADYIDQQVGSSLVDIYDDPSLPGAFGSYFFDDEGWVASPTQIVEQGIFRRGITDLYSAAKLGLDRTANGRRQDFSRKAYARMSNTFFGPGTTPVDELFAQVEDGIFLKKTSSGMEDPLGWGIQLTCPYGRRIKNGRLTDTIYAPITVSGYVPDVLQSITAVGDQWEVEGSLCEKGHKEMVRVSSGGPHLLLKGTLS